MQDISIMYLFHLAWRRLTAIVVVACLFAAMTFAYCKFVVNPRYKASTAMYVTNGKINSEKAIEDADDDIDGVSTTDVSASIYLAYTIVDFLKQPNIYKEMVETFPEYKDVNYKLLKSKIEVSRSAEDKSMLIYISAVSTDPDEAIKLANDFAKCCQDFIPKNIDKNIKVAINSADGVSNIYPRTVMSSFVAFLIGAALAFVVAFIIDVSDQSIRGEDEFINQYEIPLLGSIPDFDNVNSSSYKGYYGKLSYRKNLKARLSGSSSADESKTNVFEKKQIPFAIVEAYKNIRTSVAYLLSSEEKSSFTITSANAGEGKSTTAANLSVAFSQLGKTVLLVDADLRRATLHKKFKIENNKGLSDVLVGNASLDEAIVTVKPGLSILTAGTMPPNPSELLDSAEFEETMKALNKRYDYVIVDTPPLNVVTDSMLVAPQTGGVILVVRDGYTPHYSIKKALGDMDFSNINVLGAVMNGSHPRNKNRYIYRKYSYGYYGSYYKYDYKKNDYRYGYSSKTDTKNEYNE